MEEGKGHKVMDDNKKRKVSFDFGPKGWVVAIFAFLVFTYVYIWENGLNYFVPSYADKYGWSSTLLYGYQTIGYVIGCIGMVFMGRIIRKHGSKVVLLVTMGIGIVALFIIGSATTLFMYAIGAILFPACCCIFCWQCLGDLGVNWFPHKRGMYMGVATIGIVASMFLVNGVIFPVMMNVGTSVVIYANCIFGICLFIFAIIFIKSNPEQAHAFPDNDRSITYEEVRKRNAVGEAYRMTSPWNSYGKCLTSPAIWAITLTTGLVLLIQRGCMANMIPAIMSYGHSQTVAAFLMTISGVLALFFNILGGVADEKFGTKKAMSICCVTGIVACIFFAFFSKYAVMIEVALILLGYAGSAGNNYQPSFTAEIFGRYDFDIPYSLIIFMSTALSSVGYVAVSAIGTSWGYQTSYLFCAAMSIIALVISVVYKGKFQGRKELDQAEIDKIYAELMDQSKA
jgi:OFA family oxalate/formate antiporter-like MFS transporter